MAWLLKPEVAQAMQAARALGYQPTAEERGKFADQMREAYASTPDDQPRNMRLDGRVAHVAIEGVLTEKPDCFALLFGGGNTTYQSIRAALARADASPDVDSIVLHISSPGGHVHGLFETLAAIEGTKKPMSVRASLAASAAYGIAAVAGPITAVTPASEFGSVGVAVRLWKDEEAVDIASTEAPKKRPDVNTEEGIAAIREELDALHEIFVDAIARGRGTTAAKVNAEFGRGGVFLAKQARAAGMIDSVAKQPRRERASAAAEDHEEHGAPPIEAAAESGAEELRLMNLEQLKAQHPALYAAAVAEGEAKGAEKERKRAAAHLKRGQACGDLAIAIRAIAAGVEYGDPEYASEYDSAADTRRDRTARKDDNKAPEAALKGAGGGALAAEDQDLGDQVLAALEAEKGKIK